MKAASDAISAHRPHRPAWFVFLKCFQCHLKDSSLGRYVIGMSSEGVSRLLTEAILRRLPKPEHIEELEISAVYGSFPDLSSFLSLRALRLAGVSAPQGHVEERIKNISTLGLCWEFEDDWDLVSTYSTIFERVVHWDIGRFYFTDVYNAFEKRKQKPESISITVPCFCDDTIFDRITWDDNLRSLELHFWFDLLKDEYSRDYWECYAESMGKKWVGKLFRKSLRRVRVLSSNVSSWRYDFPQLKLTEEDEFDSTCMTSGFTLERLSPSL